MQDILESYYYIVGSSHSIYPGSNCGAILGGSGNVINGFQWAGVFGQNVNGVLNCAFHVNQLYAQNMVEFSASGACPIGTLYFCNVDNAVYIK